MLRKVSLSSVSYELGKPRRIADLPEIAARPELSAALSPERAGLRHYRESDEPVCALALRAARRTLDESGLAPERVDALVFATDSLVNTPEQYREIGALLRALGLVNAYPLNVTLSDCGNLAIALRAAAALVRAGEMDQVLVVSADVARLASPASRIIGGGIAVGSDAAASCLIGVDEGPFLIEAAAQRTDAALLAAEGERASQLASRIRAHRALFQAIFARAGVGPRAIARVFPNHFARHVLLPFFEDSGFVRAQIHLESAARAGHCFGSDCLVGLLDHTRASPVAEGDRFLLVGAGVSQLGAVLVRAAYPTEPDCAGALLA